MTYALKLNYTLLIPFKQLNIMEIILYIILYLLPGVIGYILTRKAYLKRFNRWTVDDRNCHLFGILCSFAFLLFGVFVFTEASSTEDKQSKW